MRNRDLDIADYGYSKSVNAYFSFENNTPKISVATVTRDADERVEGTMLDLDKYNHITMIFPNYKILDSKGNFTLDMESAPEIVGVEGELNELEFHKASISDLDGEFFVVFIIHDTNDEIYTSNLMKVGN